MTLRQFVKRRLVKRQLVNRHLVKYDNWSSTSIGQVEKECVDSSSRNKNLVIIENEWEGGRVSIKSIIIRTNIFSSLEIWCYEVFLEIHSTPNTKEERLMVMKCNNECTNKYQYLHRSAEINCYIN